MTFGCMPLYTMNLWYTLYTSQLTLEPVELLAHVLSRPVDDVARNQGDREAEVDRQSADDWEVEVGESGDGPGNV